MYNRITDAMNCAFHGCISNLICSPKVGMCAGYAGVRCNEQAGRMASKAIISGTQNLGRMDILQAIWDSLMNEMAIVETAGSRLLE